MFEEFRFPDQGEAKAYWEAQKILGRNNSRFNAYFRCLIYKVTFVDNYLNQSRKPLLMSFSSNLISALITYFYENVSIKTKRHKFDILLNPSQRTFYRKTEQELIINLVTKILEQDLKICILYSEPNIVDIIKKSIKNHKKADDVFFFNPENEIRQRIKNFLNYAAEIISQLDYQKISNLLNQHQIDFKQNYSYVFQREVFFNLCWLLASQKIDFDMAILRVEWDLYSFPIKSTAKRRFKQVLGLQHGVVSHTLDIPVGVNRFLTFGEQSAQTLQKLNLEFATATGQTNLCSDFQASGSIIDNIHIQSNNYDKFTVLIIDQSVAIGINFYGLSEQIKELELLVEELLLDQTIKKVIIRLHPEAQSSDFWNLRLEKYSGKLEISEPQQTLEADIARSSIAIGLFSGALTIAASSGLPSYFLATNNGYYTPDLSCYQGFILSREKIFDELKELVTNEDFYLQKRREILEQSSFYYAKNQKIELNRSFLNKFFDHNLQQSKEKYEGNSKNG